MCLASSFTPRQRRVDFSRVLQGTGNKREKIHSSRQRRVNAPVIQSSLTRRDSISLVSLPALKGWVKFIAPLRGGRSRLNTEQTGRLPHFKETT